MVVTTLAEEPKKQQSGDAWLEEALLLAASELASFRASAQAERERLLHAQEAARGRIAALEAELQKRELQHLEELNQARTQLDTQLGQRAKAWAEFSTDLRDRLASMSQLREQHEQAIE